MRLHGFTASIVAAAVAGAAWADTTIVDENFDSYADTAAMEAVWTPDDGAGYQPIGGPVGILVPDPDNLMGLTPPYNDPQTVLAYSGSTVSADDVGYQLPDLSFTKTSDAIDNQVSRGQTVTYTMRVTNNSATTQTGITLTDPCTVYRWSGTQLLP